MNEKETKTGNLHKGYEKRLARQLAKCLLEKKATDVVIMDMRKLTTITDFFVVCSADSDVQVKAIADHIQEKMKKKNLYPWHKEGYNTLRWVLLDYVVAVVHIFLKDTRQYYNLEGFWGDAKMEVVED